MDGITRYLLMIFVITSPTVSMPSARRGHLEQQQVLAALTAETTSLHSGTIDSGLVGVDTTDGLLAVEEILHRTGPLSRSRRNRHQRTGPRTPHGPGARNSERASSAPQIILIGELLGILDHLLDLFLRQTTFVVRDGDIFSCAGGLVLRTNVQDAVGVDLKSDLDLRLAARNWRIPPSLNLPSKWLSMVMGRSFTKTMMFTAGWLSR